MASTGMIQIGVVVLALATMAWTGGIQAQSGCTSVLLSLAPCLSYVTGSSSTPSSSCCSQLASVVNTQPQCLCTVLNGGGSVLGFNINQTLALALPGACNVKTPPVSKCGAAGSLEVIMPPPAESPNSN
ncbi:Non-specific lipid-transfer protein-like protein [Camellia lanceoleosa]|uniref:Non-specific lipid-transfer protein-like protein n=1 Tax=Camellia lanceoleosa TaxID=1840588 RepID=A0ACC0GSG8_9ERIC|nr:Non-specific lipid-transfer protein-like protein [Camellia lanceoleosa]